MNELQQQSILFESIAHDLHSQGYSIQADVLPPSLTAGLLQQLQKMDAACFRPAGVGRAGDHHSNAAIRRDDIAWIESHEGAQGQWLSFCSELQQHLNRRLLLGLFSFESHFAHYAPGAFYKTHVDAFKGQANRVLSVVYYLNPQWDAEDGGEMVLYSEAEPHQELCRVMPLAGTLAVFLSEEFPHEVLPARRDRYSIAGWYRVNTSTGQRIDPPA